MAREAQSLRPWFLDLVPLMVVLLIAAHVFALASLLDFQTSYRQAAPKKKGALIYITLEI
ncbi:hypothetical protein COLO4_18990 [Corchorus olitorius]|uniref:Uncharacterized protein n=1 Tax=Corchorus olitorius TaxID=93759 RepID=A0A1R3J762_9ROSI|nr:hypothetical protein COLO4_18990 [Corchorus olitorius]